MVYSTYPLWQRGVGTFAYVALTTLGIAILINRGLFADSAITGLFLPMGQGVAVGVTITALVVLKQTTPMGALLAMIYRPAKSLARIGIVLLLALETCVTIANFAEIAGAFDARDACANINNFRAVVLYSKQSLALEGSTVTEEARPMPTWLPKTLNVPSAAASGIGAGAQPGNPFAYVYRGLRILKKTNTKWILITSDWNPKTGRIVQLSDSPDIRFDYLE